MQRLEQLEQELHSLDVDSRRCNLKFLGVREPTRDNYRANVNVIVDALNECSSSRTWEHSDIQRAHRLGARRQRSGQPRPLIAEFHRWSDRMEILTDGALWDLLRQEGIRVTSGPTTRQRNEIQYYHQQGKLAYFKNGKLRVEERRPHPSGDRQPYPSQRSQQEHRGYHDDHDFRDHEDWPLPHRPDRETSEVGNQRSHRKWKDDRNQTRRSEDDSLYKYRGQQMRATGMRATGTGRPTSPGTTTMVVATIRGTGGTINGTARKWKTQAADDRTHTQNRIMVIGQTGTVRWTTASHGQTTSAWGKATTSGATTAGADRSTSSRLNCCTVAPTVATLTGTASLPQSAAKHGVCTGDKQAVTYAVGKETRATPAETHTTAPTPATLYLAAGRTVKSSSHAQPR